MGGGITKFQARSIGGSQNLTGEFCPILRFPPPVVNVTSLRAPRDRALYGGGRKIFSQDELEHYAPHPGFCLLKHYIARHIDTLLQIPGSCV